ncbi:immune inhibitor A domain-containing protein [Oryzobacter telluris]|uniref:immune inhibitor A domain-containing protein n=1 Tax=Oryzobacter telluris TaxID=3149179 RepID=UPI00370D9C9B
MKPRIIAAATGAAALACALAVQAPAQAQQTNDAPSASTATKRPDNRPGPKTAEQQRKQAKALALLRKGKAQLKPQKGGGATVALTNAAGETEFAEFPVDKTDKVFTILSEFGETPAPGKLGSDPGPLHNEIAEPGADDNSTYWIPDFDKAHYERMFNGPSPSFADFYAKQSGGKYTAINTVSDWVKVPGNSSTYGDNTVEDYGGSWAFIRDSANAWYAKEKAAGKTDAQIKTYLARFDVWDRNDYDGDGNFNEADGYIDHFQAVHSGAGEEAGAPEDAIWSHRWFAYPGGAGTAGPTQNRNGGTQIGDSGLWIGDYTVEPENGGLGVFTHEFGHDLGLPDYYDTAGGENGTAFWTIMSSGSWLNEGEAAGDAIGTTPGGFGPEEKLFLGWLDHSTVTAGTSGTYTLSPSEQTLTGQDQAVKVNLPDSSYTDAYTTPKTGSYAWWSGRGDDLKNTLTRSLNVTAGQTVTVTADLWYQIEEAYDYLYAEYSTNGGTTWTQAGTAITGEGAKWSGKRWTFKPTTTGAATFRFRYATDGGYNEAGAFIDNIAIKLGNTVAVTDGAESGDNGWTSVGWKRSTGTEKRSGERYYLLENRQYVGYDHTLQVGPYQFDKAYTAPDHVERFPFQNGMLVWLVDHGQPDNNVITHPGAGYAMPVDARPNTLTYSDGSSPSNRREPFDAVFGLEQMDPVCLHKEVAVKANGKTTIQTLLACNERPGMRDPKPTFDDSDVNAYYDLAAPQNSVKVAGVGVTATVTGGTTGSLTVKVSNPAAKP